LLVAGGVVLVRADEPPAGRVVVELPPPTFLADEYVERVERQL
jgi:hypothetical protein